MARVEAHETDRKLGANNATRVALIDAAEQLMCEEGYAAVTTRRIAAKSGLKPALIHYYFRGMEELFLEVFRRGSEQSLKSVAAAVTAEQPLRVLCELSGDPRRTRFTMEFMALANHSELVRAEIAAHTEKLRRLELEAVTRFLERRGIELPVSPLVVTLMVVNISRVFARETALGISFGHTEMEEFFETFLRGLETGPGAEARG